MAERNQAPPRRRFWPASAAAQVRHLMCNSSERCEKLRTYNSLLRLASHARTAVEKLMTVVTKLRVVATDNLDPLGTLWKQALVQQDLVDRGYAVVRGIDLRDWYLEERQVVLLRVSCANENQCGHESLVSLGHACCQCTAK